MPFFKWCLALLVLLFCGSNAFSQQLLLGKTPYGLNKSAVLELNTDNQGLLLPRLTDTVAINALNPPDGMIIYFVPGQQLLVRTNGFWATLAPLSELKNYWFVNGNANAGLKKLGTTNSFDLPFITNNAERLRITAAGNVGIGNSAPTQRLDVTGNVRFSGALMPGGNAGSLGYVLVSSGAGAPPTWQDGTGIIASSSWVPNGNSFGAQRSIGTINNYALPFITNNTERMRIAATGNIGVGTSNPTELFQVNGNAFFGSDGQSGRIKISNTASSSTTDIYTDDDVMFRISNSGFGQTGASLQLKPSSQNYLFSFEGRGGLRYYSRNSLSENFKVDDGGELHSYGTGNNSLNGRLGIGNASPSERLDVTGNIRFSGALMPNNTAGTSGFVLKSNGAGAAPTWVDVNTLVATPAAWMLGGNSVGSLQRLGTTSNYDISFITNNSEAMRLTTNNRLGIGTSNPSEALDVNGNIKISGGNRRLIFTTPGADPDAVIEHRTYSGSESNELLLYVGNDHTNSYGPDRIRMVAEEFRVQTFGNASGNLGAAESETGTNTRLLVTSSGDVGIGTATPEAKLDVNGSIRLGSNGTTLKNVISLEAVFTSSQMVAGGSSTSSSYSSGYVDVFYTLPSGSTLASTRATIAISPDRDLPVNVSIAYARPVSTTQIKIRFINTSTSNQTIASGTKLYITITDY